MNATVAESAEGHADDRSVRTLRIDAPGRLVVAEVPDQPLGPGRFRVDTCYSGLSLGTELTWYRGTNPALHSGWDDDLALFRPDRPSVRYPIDRFGYMEVARVVTSRTRAVADGDLVAMTFGHRSGHTADPVHERVVVLPDDLDPMLGVFVAHLGPICANGLLHAGHDQFGSAVREVGEGVRGRDVVVVGAGLVGLMTGLFARWSGAAAVTVVDATAERRNRAELVGLAAVPDDEDTARTIKERFAHGQGDRGASIVFQCRGQASALATALRCLRPQGTVVDLAFYPAGAEEVRLGEEFHHNGLTIRCAQIGRVPRGLASQWDRERLSAETIDLLRDEGDAIRRHLITDVIAFEEAPRLFEEVSARRRQVSAAILKL
jgi:threonine dehydrogenase-like Zn-dependent dehydrogenase